MKKTTKIIASLSALLCSALLVGTTDLLINPPEYETVSASTATTTSVLNDCESAKVGAIEAVGTVELSTENVVQGSHSVKVTTTKAWAPLLIYLKKDGVPLTREQLTQLDHIEITVYNANTAGMNFYFYNHNLGWAYGG